MPPAENPPRPDDTLPIRVTVDGEPHDPPSPITVPGYTLGPEIGRGGMGTVYEAVQESPHRTVAIKVLRSSGDPDLLARFTHEAEVLGWLQHPAIAHVYASGLARDAFGERPYIVMERVDGIPIDTYVERNTPSLEERLELLTAVIDGVQHAHQKGVVHRDLKPANILVDASGEPKIVDFGVARAVDMDSNLTVAGELLGTLGYMSPEQVAGEPGAVDTRADVYALGVLAYRLLSGRMPLVLDGLPLAQASRRVAEDAPLPLKNVAPHVPADVATIVHKALMKDRERRYGSAAALGDDIARFLAREPIQARPPSATYRFGRWVARQRGLAAGLALTFVALAVGAGVASTLYVQERATRQDLEASEVRLTAALAAAEARTDDMRETHVLFSELMRQSLPHNAGNEVRLVETLEGLARSTATRFDARPAQRFWFDSTLGSIFSAIGSHEDALRHVERARAAAEELVATGEPEPTFREVSSLDYSEAASLRGLRRYAEALEVIERSRSRETAGDGSTYDSRTRLAMIEGSIHLDQQRFDEAFAVSQAAIEELSRWVESAPRAKLVIADLGALAATALAQQGRFDEALEAIENARDHLDPELAGPTHAANLAAVAASLQFKRGKYREAEEGLTLAIDELGPRMGEKQPILGSLHATRALARQDLGDLDGAEADFDAALALQRATSNGPHPLTAQYLMQRGQLRLQAGRPEDGEADLRAALAELETLEGPDAAMRRAYTLTHFVPLFIGRGDYDDAESHLEQALAIKGELFGTTEHPSCQSELMGLSHVARARGDVRDAVERGLVALAVIRRSYPADHPQVKAFIELIDADISALRAEDAAAAEPLHARLEELID